MAGNEIRAFLGDLFTSDDVVLQIALSVGIILITAKYFGTLAKKIGIPQVAGQIIAGLLLKFLPFFREFGGTVSFFVSEIS